MSHTIIKKALISVSDKAGIDEFAAALRNLNVDILSTGGSYMLLIDNNISATVVSVYTG